MKVRSVTIAFVSSVFIAALVANSGSTLATDSSSNPLAVQAYSALTSGDSARAVSLYSQAIESRSLAPEMLANALLNRALAYQQLTQNGEAIDDYTAALSLDAMSASLRATALYNRGLSQQKLNQLPLAIEDFTSALLLNPEFSHAFLSRANALRDSGQYLFALSDYERAVKYNHPDLARVYFGQSQTFDLLMRPNDARRSLEAALSANPNYAPAQEKLNAMSGSGAVPPAVATASNDPIVTGSISAVGGSTLVHKPDLPLGVEPPQNLLAAGDVVSTDAPVFNKGKKLYTDRLAAYVEAATPGVANAAVPATEPEKIIAVESVPDIPPQEKLETAATSPVATPLAESNAAAPITGWAVQVASAGSEETAWATWKNMQKKFKVLADKSPVVVRADLGAKGIFYRVRLAGFDNQDGAKSACSRLKSGGVTCFVSKS
jgi:tetratricopeptide (TPR) repeat protein